MPSIKDRLFGQLNAAEAEGPTQIQDEQQRTFHGPLTQGVTEGTAAPGVDVVPDGDDNRPAVTDEGRAEGCLDSACGDCDMK